jgi:hypothetical protein
VSAFSISVGKNGRCRKITELLHAALQRSNQPLYRAYLLKESLAEILSSLRPENAVPQLDDWLG